MSSDSNKPKAIQLELPVTITGEGRDEWGRRYFKFSVNGSKQSLRPFSSDEIHDDPNALFKELSNVGANVFTQALKARLLKHIEDRQPDESAFNVITRLGWTDSCFVFPDQVIGTSKKPIELVLSGLDQHMLAKYRRKGTLEEWQEHIGALCDGNSRLMFAVSLSFTGPVLRYVKGVRSGGFQISGPGETGKTTAMMVAGSIWGCHRSPERQEKGFAESWHTTGGKVEVTALAHNETVLLLDETKRAGKNDQARAEAVVDISFSLAENTERERLNQGPARAWRMYFLSTSNYTLPQLAGAHLEIAEAELGRLPDIPCPNGGHGIYESLHGHADGAALTDELKSRCRKFFGAPSLALVRKLVTERTKHPVRLRKFLRDRRKRYMACIAAKAKAAKLKPLYRASGRFATVYAAGCLAIHYGVLSWDRGDLLKAILSCQLDGLRLTACASSDQEPSMEALKERLVQYIRDNRSQFVDLNRERPQLGTSLDGLLGYTAKHKGTDWFYLTRGQVEQIIGDGPNAQLVLRRFIAENLLAQPKRGYVVQRPIYKGGKGNQNFRWVVAFRSAIVEVA
jgi:putative DNA primase/helicase